jgi:hypothetical protein
MFLHVQLLSRAKVHQKISRAKESTVEDSCLILLNGKGFSGAREIRVEEVRYSFSSRSSLASVADP